VTIATPRGIPESCLKSAQCLPKATKNRRSVPIACRALIAAGAPNRALWSHVPVQFELPAARWEGVMRIAVTGASGQIGSQVVRLLAGDQAHQVVALSRRVLPSGRWPAGVSARAADYADPDALSTALRGADTLVFVSSDGPVAQVMVHHDNVIRAARASGVAHIVALSGLDADPGSPFCYAVSYGYTERLLAGSGCLVSIARASIYSEFFTGFLTRARASGQVRLPAAGGRISLVSRADVARCLAALAVRPAGGHHDITGPESPGPGCRLSFGGTRVGHRAGVCRHHARRAPCGDGYRRGGPVVDVRVLDDVRLDPGATLGGGLR
jgi:NAD(P)H dehydrogenase (quinone)